MKDKKAEILVVEDDASVRNTICWLLWAHGYEARAATDGFDALLQLREREPDVLLSDLNMPGMSGFELLSVVRRRFPTIVTVATSGAYATTSVPTGVIADAFYPKGMDNSISLLKTIQEALERGPAGHDDSTAPVWIPRNGKDHNGHPYVVLTCTECLRSFPFTVTHEPDASVLTTPCIYCPHEVRYIIDFSRSVDSPPELAARKAQAPDDDEGTVLENPPRKTPEKARAVHDSKCA